MPARAPRHPTVAAERVPGTFDTVALAVAVSVALVTGAWLVVLGAAATAALVRSPRLGAATLVLAGGAVVRGDAAWDGLRPDALGPYDGWVTVTGDPQVLPDATRIVLTIDGERFETWVRGRVRRRARRGVAGR